VGPQEQEAAAVKLLTLPWQLTAGERATFRSRFLRESRALSRLQHPHILPLWGYGEVDDVSYMIMPLMEGGTLSTRVVLEKERLPLSTVADILSQIASALDYAHAQGIIHRDVKPSNVLFDAHNQAYLGDFGIAHLVEATERVEITSTGQVLGTPYYMAPEQIEGGAITPSIDVYALGVVLYLMVTGQVPFQGDTPLHVALQHLQEAPVPPRMLRPDLPAAAEAVVLQALAKRPGDRFASAGAFADAFNAAIASAGTDTSQDSATAVSSMTRPTPGDSSPALTLVPAVPRRIGEALQDSNGAPGGDVAITALRRATLQSAYDRNRAANKPPYSGVLIETPDEVVWIIATRDWSGEEYASGKARPDLSGTDMHDLDLRRMSLNGATLRGANLRGANLRSVRLEGADLTDADLRWADASAAKLRRATLAGALLERATLSGAALNRVNLTDANLRHTDLSGADLEASVLVGADMTEAVVRGARLRGARMDVGTTLTDLVLDTKTQLGDVVWNGVPLTRVAWAHAPRLGDESGMTAARGRAERARKARDAARAYGDLALALHAQGLLDPASQYRLRAQQLERRTLHLERRYGAWVFSALLNLVAGYGERPGRTLVAYLTVIVGFAGIYHTVAQLQGLGADLPLLSALIFSVTAFHGRGFFPGTLPALTTELAALAATEAIVGLFIELVFIATFSRRFLGS
jgi:serine/threonine protein kinase